MVNKQIFLSHSWQLDKENRNNHTRVCELANKLESCGWTVWLDEHDMFDNIDVSMANGIDNSDAVIICLTEKYFIKINDASNNPRIRDNCLKEWTYANARNKIIIPVIMEKYLLNKSNWPGGIISLYFGSTLYIDASSNNLNYSIILIDKRLKQYGLKITPNSTPSTSCKVSPISTPKASPEASPVASPVASPEANLIVPMLELPKNFIDSRGIQDVENFNNLSLENRQIIGVKISNDNGKILRKKENKRLFKIIFNLFNNDSNKNKEQPEIKNNKKYRNSTGQLYELYI